MILYTIQSICARDLFILWSNAIHDNEQSNNKKPIANWNTFSVRCPRVCVFVSWALRDVYLFKNYFIQHHAFTKNITEPSVDCDFTIDEDDGLQNRLVDIIYCICSSQFDCFWVIRLYLSIVDVYFVAIYLYLLPRNDVRDNFFSLLLFHVQAASQRIDRVNEKWQRDDRRSETE